MVNIFQIATTPWCKALLSQGQQIINVFKVKNILKILEEKEFSL